MVRKQIDFDEELGREREALAASTGRAEAVHVRAAIRAYVREHREAEIDRDPLLDLIGLVEAPEGPLDSAEHHDHYLYGASKQEV